MNLTDFDPVSGEMRSLIAEAGQTLPVQDRVPQLPDADFNFVYFRESIPPKYPAGIRVVWLTAAGESRGRSTWPAEGFEQVLYRDFVTYTFKSEITAAGLPRSRRHHRKSVKKAPSRLRREGALLRGCLFIGGPGAGSRSRKAGFQGSCQRVGDRRFRDPCASPASKGGTGAPG